MRDTLVWTGSLEIDRRHRPWDRLSFQCYLQDLIHGFHKTNAEGFQYFRREILEVLLVFLWKDDILDSSAVSRQYAAQFRGL